MTIGTFVDYYLMTFGLYVAIGAVMLAISIRRRWQGRYSYVGYPWHDDTILSPGVYWIYGDSRYLTRTKWRLMGYAAAFVVSIMSFAYLGILIGLSFSTVLGSTSLVDQVMSVEMSPKQSVIYILPIVFSILHLVSMPSDRFFQFLKIIAPLFGLWYMAMAAYGAFWVDGRVSRLTEGACYFFAETQVCELLYA